MALVNRHFRNVDGVVQVISVDEADPLVVLDGWTYEPDGAAIFAAQDTAATARVAELAAEAATELHSLALARLATLQLIVDAINAANPAANMTVEQLVEALSGTPADWQILVGLLP